jgi:hypothetical protein
MSEFGGEEEKKEDLVVRPGSGIIIFLALF